MWFAVTNSTDKWLVFRWELIVLLSLPICFCIHTKQNGWRGWHQSTRLVTTAILAVSLMILSCSMPGTNLKNTSKKSILLPFAWKERIRTTQNATFLTFTFRFKMELERPRSTTRRMNTHSMWSDTPMPLRMHHPPAAMALRSVSGYATFVDAWRRKTLSNEHENYWPCLKKENTARDDFNALGKSFFPGMEHARSIDAPNETWREMFSKWLSEENFSSPLQRDFFVYICDGSIWRLYQQPVCIHPPLSSALCCVSVCVCMRVCVFCLQINQFVFTRYAISSHARKFEEASSHQVCFSLFICSLSSHKCYYITVCLA